VKLKRNTNYTKGLREKNKNQKNKNQSGKNNTWQTKIDWMKLKKKIKTL